MAFYIEEYIIEKRDLNSWADEVGIKCEQRWIRDIAQAILSWNNKDEFISITTSGSTGVPKRIQLSKIQMRFSALKTGEHFELTKGMLTLNCLPAKYIAGLMMIIRAVVLELNQLCIEPKINLRFDSDRIIDFAAMTPIQLESTLATNRVGIDKIRKIILGGGPVMPRLLEIIQKINVSCFATYGMTETITHIASHPLNGPDKTDVFRALEGVHFSEENGNVIIHADHLETPVRTTDQVELIDKKHFRWLGRSDHIINRGGVKIHPEQVEQQLRKFIDDRFIICGSRNDLFGEEIALILESEEYGPQGIINLKEKLLNLPKLQRPDRILFTDRFIETPNGKIKRNINLYTSSST